ncbi:MAG: radical SAM family heme chaperone HemW [Lachnospiraceae bacterium]|nr:radical SAM family heme chaperone HemW [Lachnospiraceae bacterium]
MDKPEKRELSLYVHIPFCKSKCNYCDFLSFGGCGYSEQKQYIEALCKEIAAYKAVAAEYVVKTIFFGGGTPSYVEAGFVTRVMETIRDVFLVEEKAEITLEGNPDSLTKDKLVEYRRAGINRLSIGLQSANDRLLKTLGRVHNYDQFVAAYSSARQAGFENINVDIMSGLPGESSESYVRTLAKVVELQPEHISAYSLIVEDGTPLGDNEALLEQLPSEEMDRQLYAKTKMLLKNSGYDRYEISNYSKKGYACKHNLVYWTGGEYLGVGLGASSYMTVWLDGEHQEKIRFHGVENMDEYVGRFLQCEEMREDAYTNVYHFFESNLEEDADGNDWSYEDSFYDTLEDSFAMVSGMDVLDECNSSHEKRYRQYEDNVLLEFIRDYYRDLQFLRRKDEMEEFMFLGLRCTAGVSKAEFKKRFLVDIESVYGKTLSKYKEQRLLIEENDRICLSDAGIDVSNVIMAEFMI